MNKYYKWLFFLSFILFFILTLNHQFAYLNLGYDYILQGIVTKSFINGNSFSVPIANSDDLSNIDYIKTALWPLGYNFLQLPLLKLLDYNIILIYRILFIFSSIFLFLSILGLLRRIKDFITTKTISLIILFWTFSYFPFKNIGVSDILSLSFFILSGCALLKFISVEKKTNKLYMIYAIYIGIISFIPSFFRYAYYPISFVVPFLFFIYLYGNDKIKYLRWAFIPILITTFLIAAQMQFTKIYFNAGTNPVENVIPVKTNLFYFENLKVYDSVFLNSFVDDSIVTRFLSEIFSLKIKTFWIYFMFSLFILILLALNLFIILRQHKYSHENDKNVFTYFVLIGLLGSIMTVLFLSAISIWFPSFSLKGEQEIRTWVMFSRYHALPMIFIQIFLFVCIFNKRYIISKCLKYTTITILLFCAFLNTSYWFYHEYKFKVYQPTDEINDAITTISYIDKINIHKLIKVLITSKVDNENEFAENNFNGFLSIYTDANISIKDIKNKIMTSRPVLCIISIPKDTTSDNYIKASAICENYAAKPILFSQNLNKEIKYFLVH